MLATKKIAPTTAFALGVLIVSLQIAAENTGMPDEPALDYGYTRMYEDSEGVSHFGEATLPLELQNYAPPAPPIAVRALQNVESATVIYIPKGTFEDWHPAPRRQWAFILQGAVEVTVGDGESRIFEPGSVVLLEDTKGRGHTTRVLDDEDHVSVMVAVSEDD